MHDQDVTIKYSRVINSSKFGMLTWNVVKMSETAHLVNSLRHKSHIRPTQGTSGRGWKRTRKIWLPERRTGKFAPAQVQKSFLFKFWVFSGFFFCKAKDSVEFFGPSWFRTVGISSLSLSFLSRRKLRNRSAQRGRKEAERWEHGAQGHCSLWLWISAVLFPLQTKIIESYWVRNNWCNIQYPDAMPSQVTVDTCW